jgi:hypothetical protein
MQEMTEKLKFREVDEGEYVRAVAEDIIVELILIN